MILYLDFDGVLHPDEAYWYGPERGVLLKTANLPIEYADHDLFCYAASLTEILDDFPEIRIVLSTSWVDDDRMGYASASSARPGRRWRLVMSKSSSTFAPAISPTGLLSTTTRRAGQ